MRHLAPLRLLLLLLPFHPVHLFSQVFELSGGASNAYASKGAALVIHGEHSETSFGAGVVGKRFGAGGQTVRALRNGSMALGEQQFRFDTPTDLFDTSHVFFVNGVSLHQNFSEDRRYTAFAGFASAQGGTAFFHNDQPSVRTVFGQWTRRFHPHCVAVSTGLLSHTVSFLESVECLRSRSTTVSLTAGVGGGSPYAAAGLAVSKRRLRLRAAYIYAGSSFRRSSDQTQLTPEPVRENVSASLQLSRSFSLYGLHQHFLSPSSVLPLPSSPAPGERSSVDQASLQLRTRASGVNLTLLHSTVEPTVARPGSTSNVAFSLAFDKTVGPVRWTETLLESRPANSPSTSILISSLGVTFNSHLRWTESVTLTGGQVNLSHGGELRTRFSTIHADYQLFYLPARPDSPFQQSLVFDAVVRVLPRLSLRASSSVSQSGAPLYTASLSSVFSRSITAAPITMHSDIGIHMLHGIVVDTTGAPVEGAALLVGSERLYTGADGIFSFREKRSQSHPFHVLTEEFLVPGRFREISVPARISTAEAGQAPTLRIVIARIAETSAPQSSSSAHSPLILAESPATTETPTSPEREVL